MIFLFSLRAHSALETTTARLVLYIYVKTWRLEKNIRQQASWLSEWVSVSAQNKKPLIVLVFQCFHMYITLWRNKFCRRTFILILKFDFHCTASKRRPVGECKKLTKFLIIKLHHKTIVIENAYLFHVHHTKHKNCLCAFFLTSTWQWITNN